METTVVSDFESMKDEMKSIALNNGMLSLSGYMEYLRILLWEKIILTTIKGSPSFTKIYETHEDSYRNSFIKSIFID